MENFMKHFVPLTYLFLLLFAIVSIISGIIWTITEPNDHWLWFSRFSLGLILWGICAIIQTIHDKDK